MKQSLPSYIYDNLKLSYLSAIPAGLIDEIYLEEPRGLLGKTAKILRLRALYVVFLGLLAIDLVTSGLTALTYALRSLLASEDTQDNLLSIQKRYATVFGRSLYALLASLSLIGFVFPKLIIFYFTPERKKIGVSAGGGHAHAKDAELAQPENKEQLQELIRNAISEKRAIIPMGAGRSQGQQFLPPNSNGKKPLVIDLQRMKTIQINAEDQTATVEAGVLWSELQCQANAHSLAVKVMQASNIFSVGGSIGTNIHGWDYHTGMLSNAIVSMDIITTDGEMKTISPNDTNQENHKLFHHITGGLGLFGVVYQVTIKLAPNENLKRCSKDVIPKKYVNFFENHLKNNDQVKLHLYRLSLDPDNLLGQGFTETYLATDNISVKTPNFHVEPPQGTRFQRVMLNLARRFGWIRRLWWNDERQNFLNQKPVSTTNEIMQAPINAMFNASISESEWLQEFFLPGDKLDSFLKEFGQLLMKNKVTLLNATVRFVKQNDQSPMSYAFDGDRFAVVICFNQSLAPSQLIAAKKWLREAQHLAVSNGGTYYLPYQHVSSPDDFNQAYPRAKNAENYKKEIDPNQLFISGFQQKYMNPSSECDHTKDVIKHSIESEAFEGFLKHILMRVDAKKLYSLLKDIITYSDTHAEIYDALCARLPEIMPDILSDFRHKLTSLEAIKRQLGEQARSLLPKNLKTIHGIVEIGSPGRYITAFKQHYTVTGRMVSVNESHGISDYVDSGSLHPYDVAIKLDYQKLNLSALDDNSAQLITCYVGLHHFPENKLNDFLEEIKRILAPGGYFLLDDHDISDQTTKEMADLAHLVFNAVNGVSLQEEMQEVRNFQPMSHWINKLQEHGINCVVNSPDVHMIRPGDPTRNRMICSQKPDLRASRHGLFSQPTERNNQVEEGINLTPAFY